MLRACIDCVVCVGIVRVKPFDARPLIDRLWFFFFLPNLTHRPRRPDLKKLRTFDPHTHPMIEKSSPHRRMSLTSKHIAGELFPKSKGVRQVTILATVQVSQLPAMEKFKQILTEKLLSNYRFTSIPTELGGGKWVWKEGTTKVDLDLHLIQAEIVTSSAASSSTQPTPTLTEYLESIVFREWDFKSPLWRIHLLKNVSDFVDEGVAVGLQQNLNREGSYSSSASAVIIEVHHAIGDGISLMQLAHSLFTDASGNSISDWTNSKKEPRRQTVMDKLRYISSIPKQWIKANSIFLLKDTQHAAKQPHSPCFSFHKQRKIIFFPTMSLDVIKKIKNGNPGSTVNDVLLSTMTGALTRYLEYKGQLQKKQMRIRSLLLYSQPKNDGDLHNRYTCPLY